jgi:hypothetical protein
MYDSMIIIVSPSTDSPRTRPVEEGYQSIIQVVAGVVVVNIELATIICSFWLVVGL